MHRVLLAGAIVALIGARLLFVHGDPSDFPQDRNIAAGMQIREAVRDYPLNKFGFETIVGVCQSFPATPEFPFMRIVGWIAGSVGKDPIVACRLFSVLMALATGIGIYILGWRISGAVGLVAIWMFALAPMAVFMGRALLPDGIMIAALVWAVVASGAGLSEAPKNAPLRLAVWLAIACLAKLPAVVFAPVVAVAYLSVAGWRNWRAWVYCAVSMLVVYLVVCLWYGLAPWWPFSGLARLSSGTNNLLSATDVALSAQGFELTAMRLVLALTWPGVMLAFAGWAVAQGKPGQRAWVNTFCILSIFFVLLTIGANTYWAAAAVPAGCILAALAAVEIARFGRWTVAPLVAVSALVLWIDPGVRQIGRYLATQPQLTDLRRAAIRLGDNGPSIFYGFDLDDVAWFVDKPGKTWTEAPGDLAKMRSWERYQYLYSSRMGGEPAMGQLFRTKPVVDTRAGDFVVFSVNEKVRFGENPFTPSAGGYTPINPKDFVQTGAFTIQFHTTQYTASPRDPLSIKMVFKNSPAPPPVGIEFVHAATGEALPIAPRSGGAWFNRWCMPRIQIPQTTPTVRGEIDLNAFVQMTYGFRLPPLMPGGPYTIRLRQLDENSAAPIDDGINTPVTVNVSYPELNAAPLKINLADAVWSHPTRIWKPAWLGKETCVWALQGDGRVWLSPRLAAGRYRLKIRGRGEYVGSDPRTRWPILEVHQPGRSDKKIEFRSSCAATHEIEISLRGPDDFIRLRVANPMIDYSVTRPFPLYPSELSGGSKMIELMGIEFLPVK